MVVVAAVIERWVVDVSVVHEGNCTCPVHDVSVWKAHLQECELQLEESRTAWSVVSQSLTCSK